MYTDEDGMVVIRGRLPQEVAALVEKALQAAMDVLSSDDSAESRPGEDYAQRRVDALGLFAEAALRRALASRDRACRFPGCSRIRHLQAHHIEHWAKGGETNPDNLIMVCRYHHWAVHEGGVRVEDRAPDGLVFRRPDGRILPRCPAPVPINGKAGETLKEANQRHGLELSPGTVDGFWDGERMDLHMAVDGLISCGKG